MIASIARITSSALCTRCAGDLASRRWISGSTAGGTSVRERGEREAPDVDVRREHVAGALADERRPAAAQLEHDAAERVEIGAMIDRDAAALLRRHVRRRPHHRAGLRHVHAVADVVAGELGDPEVEQLDPLAARHLRIGHQEDVVGLEIAMDDALGVRGGQRAGDLPRDRERRRPAKPAARRPPRQRLALEVLHDDVRRALGRPAEVVDLDDARDGGSRSRRALR